MRYIILRVDDKMFVRLSLLKKSAKKLSGLKKLSWENFFAHEMGVFRHE
jgi:hypothetical protein